MPSNCQLIHIPLTAYLQPILSRNAAACAWANANGSMWPRAGAFSRPTMAARRCLCIRWVAHAHTHTHKSNPCLSACRVSYKCPVFARWASRKRWNSSANAPHAAWRRHVSRGGRERAVTAAPIVRACKCSLKSPTTHTNPAPCSPPPPSSNRKTRRMRCYNCGEFANHIASECAQGPQPKRCHRCRSEDHLHADCPHRNVVSRDRERERERDSERERGSSPYALFADTNPEQQKPAQRWVGRGSSLAQIARRKRKFKTCKKKRYKSVCRRERERHIWNQRDAINVQPSKLPF